MKINRLTISGLILITVCCNPNREIIHINDTPIEGAFSLQRTEIDILQSNFDSTIYRDEIGYPHIDFTKLQIDNQGKIIKTYDAIILENKFIKVTLLPDKGKLYSFIYKVTGNEEFFIPEIANILGSPNKLGWWFVLGGVEYTLPDEEHGETWATAWKWEVVEDSPKKKAVMMNVKELRFGLMESITISIFPDKAYYEAHISITNPTDSTIKFQHWINPMWVPGGKKDGLTPNTEFIIPTNDVYVTERSFNNWMLSYSQEGKRLQPYENNPMRIFKNWENSGDLLAWELEKGFYSAFCHEENEGIVRIFPVEMNSGCNIWTFGYNPTPRQRKRFSGNESHKGYVEMWGGITHGFDKYYSLEPGKSIHWTELMYPYIKTKGLHFANNDFAVSFLKVDSITYAVNLCPSGDIKKINLKVESPVSKKKYLQVFYKSAFPKKTLKGYTFTSEEEDLDLIICKKGKEIIRLKPKPPAIYLLEK